MISRCTRAVVELSIASPRWEYRSASLGRKSQKGGMGSRCARWNSGGGRIEASDNRKREKTMTTGESNKEIVKQFVDRFWSNGDLSAVGTLMATDAVIHEPKVGGTAGLSQFNGVIRTAFPDWHATAEELIAEGDAVVERWTG